MSSSKTLLAAMSSLQDQMLVLVSKQVSSKLLNPVQKLTSLPAARHFAKMNPDKLILAVRTVEKGEEAKQDILRTVPNAKVEVWKLDLSRMASVQEFAARVKKDLQRLDIACLNAGIATEQWNTTSDGFETT